jgi:nitrite reductase (NADH) large subunit
VLPWLTGLIEETGIRLMQENTITEILGDKEVKAIRSGEGKVFSTQVILFGEMNEDLRLFADTGLQMDKKINVDLRFKTNIESIYAVDQVCKQNSYQQMVLTEPVTPPEVIEDQAKVVAAAIAGQEQESSSLVLTWEIEIKGLTLTFIGQTELNEGRSLRRTFNQESGKYTGIYLENNCVVGAVLVNTQDEKDKFVRLTREKGQIEPEIVQLSSGEKGIAQDGNHPVSERDKSIELIDN